MNSMVKQEPPGIMLQKAIDQLYVVFAGYGTADMHYCDCGCVDPKWVENLASKPLRGLEYEQLGFYHSSAMYVWGEVEHYKHFLPRILELYGKEDTKWPDWDLEEIKTKLDHGKWDTWPQEEQKAIMSFVEAAWRTAIVSEVREIDQRFVEGYKGFYPYSYLLKLWLAEGSQKSLQTFISYFYGHGNLLLNEMAKSEAPMASKSFLEMVQEFELLSRIEGAFFHASETDDEFALKASAVHQMLEIELRAAGLESKA